MPVSVREKLSAPAASQSQHLHGMSWHALIALQEIHKYMQVINILDLSNSQEHFFCVYVASPKHEEGCENLRHSRGFA